MAKHYTKEVEKHFEANVGKNLSVTAIAKKLGLTEAQVRYAVNYSRGKGMNIEVLKPGKLWRYGAVVQVVEPAKPKRLTVSEQGAKLAADIAKMALPDWAEAEQAFNTYEQMTFARLGTSNDGYPLVRNKRGDLFKVVPL